MLDVYDIWLYPLQDWWRTVNEMYDFMSTGQMGNFIFRPVFVSKCTRSFPFNTLRKSVSGCCCSRKNCIIFCQF